MGHTQINTTIRIGVPVTNAQHFELMYQRNPDPWRVASDWYERRKRDLLLASLPLERYRHGFEPGCGNGETTLKLLERCDRLCAVDFSQKAIQLCKERIPTECQGRLTLQSLALPVDWPDIPKNGFDLIVVSEISYYFNDKNLNIFNNQCISSLSNEGHLLLCHWIHPAPDRKQSTEVLHKGLNKNLQLKSLVAHQDTDFHLRVWQKKG